MECGITEGVWSMQEALRADGGFGGLGQVDAPAVSSVSLRGTASPMGGTRAFP